MGRGPGLEKGVGAYHNYSVSHFGVHRKTADLIGRSPRCLTRVWAFVVSLACLCLLASVTPLGNSIQAKIFYPSKLVLSYPLDYESSAQLLWELRTEEMFALSLNSPRQKSGGGAESKTHPRSLTSHGFGALNNPSSTSGQIIRDFEVLASPPFIEDVVVFPEDLDLFIVRHFSSVDQERISACRYGGEPELKSVPRMVDLLPDGRLGVSCTRPSSLTLKVENLSLEVDSSMGAALILPHANGILKPARWDEALVYAVQSTDVDVVLYVKNLFDSSQSKATEYTELENFRCRFGEAVETPVTAGALEVFRCDFPSVNHPTTIATRVKVHLIYKGKAIPSVAYYKPIDLPVRAVAGGNRNSEVGSSNEFSSGVIEDTISSKKKHLVCSCTMIWNVAQFLKEWVLFNSHLGVEKFFLYDNNSEDDIRRVVSDLSEYNVTRISWPWVKTQEAGFSNCAIEAQRECTWILFTDVDEYLFPKRWLPLTEESESAERATTPATHPELAASPLKILIQDTLKKVTAPAAVGKKIVVPSSTPASPSLQLGQIAFRCINFGPSGRTTSPPEGVTQAYTCRDRGEQRHKSMVYFPALRSSLQNKIHHFHLKPTHQTVYLDLQQAVVHHYKYQAWSEFEKKFSKRASTYVADWKEPKNLNSKDRPKGLGSEATKPPDWETSHCALNDTSLRDYTRGRFGVLGTGADVKLAWEL